METKDSSSSIVCETDLSLIRDKEALFESELQSSLNITHNCFFALCLSAHSEANVGLSNKLGKIRKLLKCLQLQDSNCACVYNHVRLNTLQWKINQAPAVL